MPSLRAAGQHRVCTARFVALPCTRAAQGSFPRGTCRFTHSTGFPAALTDDEGVVAFLRDDFMGGAQAALIAADTFLHAVITFRNICVQQFGT